MDLTIWCKDGYGYDIGNTLGSGHDDARLLTGLCSRRYKEITNIDSRIESERESAKELIRNLLNKD